MRQLWRSLTHAERAQWVVLIGGSTLMMVYLYQGHHSFYTRHLADPLMGADPYNDWYRHLYQNVAALVLLALVPLLLARYAVGRDARQLGLRLGDWRFGLKAVAVGMVVLTPLLYLGSLDPAIQKEYPLTRLAGCAPDLFVWWELTYLLYYVAWEFFFRGFNLFLLEERWGATASILYQTVPSTLLHVGKPQSEMALAIVGGLVLGGLAWRTRSFLYPLLLHWYVGACTDFFSLLNQPPVA